MKTPVRPKNSASALPRFSIGKAEITIASAAGNMIAAPAPWIMRQKMIQASAIEPVGVSPHMVEAPANMRMPVITIFLRPKTSAILPPNAKSAARVSR